ncbi:hypothetical protein EMCRGX_G026409 [Ephydatia muelleri]
MVSVLVSCEWLKEQLDAGAKGIKVIDGSWHPPVAKRNARAEFEQHHIPEAVFADVEAIKDASNPLPIMFPPPEQLEQQFSQLGISNSDHVVVYDNNSDVGMLSAPRVWFMFHVYGHTNVSILDGGLPKWIASGYPTVSGATSLSPTNFKASYNADAVYSMQALLNNCSSKSHQVLDARPKGRFDGTVPEANPSWYSGHILESINIPFTAMIDPTTKLFKTKDAIQQTFQQFGVNLDQPAVAMCSTGMTASFLVLGAYILGKQVPLYDGAWAEWQQKAPKETMKLGVRGCDLNK